MLTLVQKSKCGTLVFIIPNKEETVRFITDYPMINHKLVRNTYPLLRIGNTIQKLDGFHYVTALNLNMEYYTIRISLASQYMMTRVTEFGKFN